MVQLLVKLVAREEGVHELVLALRAVMRGAHQARGCRFAEISQSANDTRRVDYLEEWDDEDELREQFGSQRFLHLLELIETAAERPVVEFRKISKVSGLEYITFPGFAPSFQPVNSNTYKENEGSTAAVCAGSAPSMHGEIGAKHVTPRTQNQTRRGGS
jgi:quinol monooxygenase YgiN